MSATDNSFTNYTRAPKVALPANAKDAMNASRNQWGSNTVLPAVDDDGRAGCRSMMMVPQRRPRAKAKSSTLIASDEHTGGWQRCAPRSRVLALPGRPSAAPRRAAAMALHDSCQNTEIAERLSLPVQKVTKWRKRFHQDRLPGLNERQRTGRPALLHQN